ncbi:MAG: GNAT family N-acetyltransferase [Paracoccaceae bacterium]
MAAGGAPCRTEFKAFADLGGAEFHDLLKIRFDTFVLEQRSLYPEIDGRDPGALHALVWSGPEIVATLRILGLGAPDAPLSIGRIAVRADRRGAKLGRALVAAALFELEARAPGRTVTIGAQAHLEGFYERFGFRRSSAEYDDGGIPHIEMTLTLPVSN